MTIWPEKINQLEAAGWSLARISEEIKLSPQSLSDIKQGRSKEPRGMAAVRLHALHERVCPEAGESAPRKEAA